MKEIIKELLAAPDSQLDSTMKAFIIKWKESPTPIQVLEVLDNCIYGGLASGTVISILQVMYELVCAENDTTHNDVVKLAVWRNK